MVSDKVETEVKSWLEGLVAKECCRVRRVNGTRVIPLPVKNCGILVESKGKKNVIVNRLEIDTGFDFDKVKQILLSPPIPCPVKPNFSMVFCVLLTEKPLPMIVPYMFDVTTRLNFLREWVFINSRLKKSRHSIQGLKSISRSNQC